MSTRIAKYPQVSTAIHYCQKTAGHLSELCGIEQKEP